MHQVIPISSMVAPQFKSTSMVGQTSGARSSSLTFFPTAIISVVPSSCLSTDNSEQFGDAVIIISLGLTAIPDILFEPILELNAPLLPE